MDELENLLARYRSRPADQHWLIDEVYLTFPDRRAVQAVLDVAGDPTGNELGRCAAFKAFQHTSPGDADDQSRLIAVAIETATSAETASLVREYAVLALGLFADRAVVEAALVPLMVNVSEDCNIRSAAFQMLSRRGHQNRTELFRQLLTDPELADEVHTHFSLVDRGEVVW